ncbi:MAG: tetraacyldisaccharide 4'-kinase [Candidatus Eisenbacteria bacterium]|uniref:Tetraacyldisaccharide 4'-kinase n=1 Tax=Eiseniibacteriota bacterium TaxID=2212470 RepID=A0A538TX52_UNCEI|nr:MAG: tetraacyldisaccharide 4'-kinase [Candidatus Eisenbacteria bacterium]
MDARVGAVAGVSLRRAAAALYGAAWEARRRSYALGLFRPRRVAARVVSVGNLSVGGTGKTTLTLRLARAALAASRGVAVVCRNYRPGPEGASDEAALFRAALGAERVYAGASKRLAAAEAAARGHALLLVDDGFSTWSLARDLDLVLLDASAPVAHDALLPLGWLREPRRALQRADWLVLTRVTGPLDPERVARVRRHAPAARFAAGRHRVIGVRSLEGAPVTVGRVRVVTATGNARAVAASAGEARLEVTGLSSYRDHHWFTPAEAEGERRRAARERAVVLLTAKDAVRWPRAAGRSDVAVLEVEWEWVEGGEALERAVLDDDRER